MRKSIISALLFAAALPLAMSDADAAAAPAEVPLYVNDSTHVIFRSSDAQTDTAVRSITNDEVSALVQAGATVDSSVGDVTLETPVVVASTADAVAATPDAVDAAVATPGNVDAAGAAATSSGSDVSAQSASETDAEDPNAVASSAESNPESATASSAESASPSVDTAAQESTAPVPPVPGATYEPVSQVTNAPTTGELTAAASVATPTLAEVPVDDATAAPVDDNTGKVLVDADSHAEAKDRFAGLMAKLHQFENDAVDDLKEELAAIGVLLHLHTKASAQASTTGDYQAGDAS